MRQVLVDPVPAIGGVVAQLTNEVVRLDTEVDSEDQASQVDRSDGASWDDGGAVGMQVRMASQDIVQDSVVVRQMKDQLVFVVTWRRVQGFHNINN